MADGESLDNIVRDPIASSLAKVEEAKNYHVKVGEVSLILAAVSIGYGIYQLMRNPRHMFKGAGALVAGLAAGYGAVVSVDNYEEDLATERVIRSIKPEDLEDRAA